MLSTITGFLQPSVPEKANHIDSSINSAYLFELPPAKTCQFEQWQHLAQKNLANQRFRELLSYAHAIEVIGQTGNAAKFSLKKRLFYPLFSIVSKFRKQVQQATSFEAIKQAFCDYAQHTPATDNPLVKRFAHWLPDTSVIVQPTEL